MRAMKKLAVLALGSLLTAPALAVRPVTVAETEQLLRAGQGKSDGRRALLVQGLELTERCSRLCLERWEAAYPGRQTRDALVALADASALLPPPGNEVPPDPTPSWEEQERIVRLAVHFVVSTTNGFPNFLATRQTVYYENAAPTDGLNASLPQEQEMEALRSLHIVDRASSNITYRDGNEVLDSAKDKRHSNWIDTRRLSSNGEFGAILQIVITDASRGQVGWSHWERGAQGMEAHFRYTVPAEDSHYQVTFDCGNGARAYHPGYTGEFAVDPATGAILRIALSGTLPAPCKGVTSSIVTEFGPVELGGRTYTCPVHSVSLFQMRTTVLHGVMRPPVEVLVSKLNDVTFTGYRLFRSSSRIVSVEELP